MKFCIFCNQPHIEHFIVKSGKKYWYCRHCKGFFMDIFEQLPKDEQKKRYLLHDNSLQNKGYKEYLDKIIKKSADYYQRYDKKYKNLIHIFDFGSGPIPALTQLLAQKKYFTENICVKHWDPLFFAYDTGFKTGADIIFCIEVVEHFENPQKDFKKLADVGAKNSIFFIKTQPAPSSIQQFTTWWYKEDATHVAFYSQQALVYCAKNAGLELLELDNDFFILKKTY